MKDNKCYICKTELTEKDIRLRSIIHPYHTVCVRCMKKEDTMFLRSLRNTSLTTEY